MRRAIILIVALATILSACGLAAGTGEDPGDTLPPNPASSTTDAVDTTSPDSQPTTTTTSAPATTTTVPPATTTTTAAKTATTAATTSPSTVAPKIAVAPYFYIDEQGHPNRPGPFVVPVTREVPKTVAVARAAIEQLLAGPTAAETAGIPMISSAIPDGVRLLGLTISEGIATVDLSGEFEADGDSAAVAQRIAQVVFTLSRFPSVHEVMFRQDHSALAVPTGDGRLVSRPVSISDYLEFAAALHIEEPAYGGDAEGPLQVLGFGAVFEASFNYALVDAKGLIIAGGHPMTTNGTGWGGFDFTIDYDVDREQVGALIVWTHSAEDGSQIDVREYPIVLQP